ncbi:MAG: hypothetical protein HRU40_13560 [Saprospiraceae bacterium]|nr:hypothetical protein [Saprospiraceae bacterium]
MAKIIVKVWIEDDNQNKKYLGEEKQTYKNNTNEDIELEVVHVQGSPILRPKERPKY